MSRTRAAPKSRERLEPGEIADNDPELTPPSDERGREPPPHFTFSSTSHTPEGRPASPGSAAVDSATLERILDRQQQQLTLALGQQQRVMMTSFQEMFANILTSRAPTAPAVTASTTLQSKMCLNEPDAFDGSPKNTESFINSCVNTFMAQPQVYATPESQVRFALSFLKSGATKWRDALLRDLNRGAWLITTWADFEDRLRRSFGNPHRVQEAQRALHHINQNQRTAEDFFIAFEDIVADAGFCDATVVFQLLRAIRKEIRDVAQLHEPRPEYYEDWKALILKIDQNLRENSSSSSFYDNNGRYNYRPAPSFPRPYNNFRQQTNNRPSTSPTPAPPAQPVPKAAAMMTTAPVVPSSKTPSCWKCNGPHWPRQCPTGVNATSTVARQLLEKVDELDSQMETVRKLVEEVDELPENAEEDRELMIRLMEEHPLFFVNNDG